MIESIKKTYATYGKKMGEVQKKFKKYTLFINPFARLKGTLDEHIRGLQKLDISEAPKINVQNATHEEREEYYKKFNQWILNVEKAVSLGTSIRMLCPVLAESFINLILVVLAKDYFKKDKRLYDNLIRQQIDIRVKSLHINCDGFIKPINSDDTEFKNFQTLMKNRNDFLHGNIDPTQLMFEDVFFDLNNIPLFKIR